MSEVAYKIADAEAWRIARDAGAYPGSAVDAADGYIHLSTGDQLLATVSRHYAGHRDLIVAQVDLAVLGETLKWEPSRGGDLFPHLYAPLPMSAVQAARTARVDAEGRLIFEDGEPPWP